MKKILLASLLVVGLLSCKKEQPQAPNNPAQPLSIGENYIVLNGDIYNNDTVRFNYELKATNFGVSDTLILQEKDTATNPDQFLQLWFSFPHTGTNTLSWSTNQTPGSILMESAVGYSYPEITVQVTRLDAMGGLFEGSYTGTLRNNSMVAVSVVGKFSVLRQ